MTDSKMIRKILRILHYMLHLKQSFFLIRRNILRCVYMVSYGKPPPKSLYVEVTGLCNLQCSICHRGHITEELGEMDLKTFAGIVKSFPVIEQVSLMGIGEPLVNKNLLTMISICKSYGLSVGFNSNGVLLTPDLTKSLILSGLDGISFSVDGATKEIYEKIRIGADFDAVIENVKTFIRIKKDLNKKNPELGLEFVATTENVHTLLPYIDLAKCIGIGRVTVSHVITFSEEQEKNALYNHSDPRHQQIWKDVILKAKNAGIDLILPPLQAIDNSNCRFRPWQSFFVSWKGDIKPCCTYLHPSTIVYKGKKVTIPAINFGNIHKKDILQLWYSSSYIGFRNRILNKKFTSVCKNCLYSKELIPAQ